MTDEAGEGNPPSHELDKAELLSLVKKGRTAWNQWAESNPGVKVDFSNMVFEGKVSFVGFQFTGDAWFSGATFTGGAEFSGATFTSDAEFGEATFTSDAEFGEATFTGNAWFGGATFTGGAWFGGATFTGGAWFSGATFTGGAWFGGATFTGSARFSGATFTGDAWFPNIDVQTRVDFNGALFYEIPDFQTAKNRDLILLDDVVFTLRPAGWVRKVVCWLTGIRGSNTAVIARIRQLRRIANDAHSIDAERDLAILERNAEVGVAWSGLKKFSPFWPWVNNVLATFLRTPLLILYRWTSSYGRSIKLPLFWLVTTPFVWYVVHYKLYLVYGTLGRYLLSEQEISAIKSITLFGAFPISATQRPAYTAAVENLSRGSASADLPFALQASLTLQSVTSLILLFLIGLALRNFFRMK